MGDRIDCTTGKILLVARSFIASLSLAFVIGASLPARGADVDPRGQGPDVTIIQSAERIVYEYRQAGQLRMIKVVPKVGRAYYLVPRDETRGFGDLQQADMLVPRWVLIEF